MKDEELFKMALEAKNYAYAPYSHFKVGAALLTQSDKVYTGCNVECASYGACNCAERTAIYKAVSEGDQDFDTLAIASDNQTFTYPCGICRQVILEFGENIRIVVGNAKGEIQSFKIKELLPYGFSKKALEDE